MQVRQSQALEQVTRMDRIDGWARIKNKREVRNRLFISRVDYGFGILQV